MNRILFTVEQCNRLFVGVRTTA